MMGNKHRSHSNLSLAISATLHCLLGCGLGEVFGVFIGFAFGLSFVVSLIIGIVAGFIFGYLLGILPLLKGRLSFIVATKIVLATETLSIITMETGEILTEIFFPKFANLTLSNLLFWVGLVAALLVGFIAAFPVNYYLVKRGIRHHHQE